MSRLIAIIFLFLSAVGFASSLHMERAALQASPTLPLPPVGYSVASAFKIGSPGQFQIEAQVPSESNGQIPMRNKPTLGVSIEVQIERRGDKPIKIQPLLRHGGEIGFSKLDLYFSQPIPLLSGDYVLRVKTLSAPPSSNALLTLSPVIDQSGTIIAQNLFRIFGWIFLVVGSVFGIIGGWPSNHSRRTASPLLNSDVGSNAP